MRRAGLTPAAGIASVAQPSALVDGGYRQSMARLLAQANAAIGSSGVLVMVALPLLAGDLVSSLTFAGGTTAYVAGTTNNVFGILYDGTGQGPLAQSADQGATYAQGVNGWGSALTMQTPYPVTATGVYYAAILIAQSGGAPTYPTFRGAGLGGTAISTGIGQHKRLAGTSGTALTAPPSNPGNPAAVASVPLVVAR